MRFTKITILFFVVSLCYNSSAQKGDNILWYGTKALYKTKNNTFSIAPIVRFNNNISTYQNTSIDVSVKQTFKTFWHIKIIGRTWFMPQRSNRQFLWIDFGYAKQIKKVKISSHLRWHHAFDIKEIPDADFIRWKSAIFITNQKKLSPFIAVEPWLRINNDKGIRRVRIEPGVKFNISTPLSFMLTYRRETSFKGFANDSKNNMIVAMLTYKISNKKTVE